MVISRALCVLLARCRWCFICLLSAPTPLKKCLKPLNWPIRTRFVRYLPQTETEATELLQFTERLTDKKLDSKESNK